MATATSIVISTGAAMAGCSPFGPGIDLESVGCPAHFAAAVAWSSSTTRASSIQFFDAEGMVGETRIAVQGLSTSDQTPLHRDGSVSMLSTGNALHDESNIVTVDLATCQATLTRLKDALPLNLALTNGGYASVSNLNTVSYVRTYRSSSENMMAEAVLDHEFISAVASSDGKVYAKSQGWDSGTSSIIILDAVSLTEIERIDLPFVPADSGDSSLAIASNKLIAPIPTKNGGAVEDSRLMILDLGSSESRAIGLQSPSPYYVRVVGDIAYVAHTFLNPAFRPMSQYRHVSVVDMATESVTGYDLQAGIDRIDVNSESLAVLGQDDDEKPILHVYTLPEFALSMKLRLRAPSDVPDAYAATVFLPEK